MSDTRRGRRRPAGLRSVATRSNRQCDYPSRQSLGSTGSLSRANTPKTHSCTRYSGSAGRESLERFDAEGELPQGQGALESEPPRTKTRQVARRGVLRPVNNPQVVASPALDARLDQSLWSPMEYLKGFDHHAFAAGGREFLPPLRATFDGGGVIDVDRQRSGGPKGRGIRGAESTEYVEVPEVIPQRVTPRLRRRGSGREPTRDPQCR
jgi:hypothetical protein